MNAELNNIKALLTDALNRIDRYRLPTDIVYLSYATNDIEQAMLLLNDLHDNLTANFTEELIAAGVLIAV